MNDGSVPSDVRPTSPFSRSGERLDPAGWGLTDRLLDGQPLPAGVPAAYQKVAELLSAASGPPGEAELTGQQQALAAFKAARSAGLMPPACSHRRKNLLSSLKAAKLAVAAAVAAVPLGGLAAAAYAGSLPAAAQDFAHTTIGAPAPQSKVPNDEENPTAVASGQPAPTGAAEPTSSAPEPSETGMPEPTTSSSIGPDATAAAAFGLCNAWAHGGLSATSVPYHNLATAAGGKDGIEAYCAAIPHPGKSSAEPSESVSPEPSETPESTPSHGKPTDVPRGQSDHPEGKPSTNPGGES